MANETKKRVSNSIGNRMK